MSLCAAMDSIGRPMYFVILMRNLLLFPGTWRLHQLFKKLCLDPSVLAQLIQRTWLRTSERLLQWIQ